MSSIPKSTSEAAAWPPFPFHVRLQAFLHHRADFLLKVVEAVLRKAHVSGNKCAKCWSKLQGEARLLKWLFFLKAVVYTRCAQHWVWGQGGTNSSIRPCMCGWLFFLKNPVLWHIMCLIWIFVYMFIFSNLRLYIYWLGPFKLSSRQNYSGWFY